MTRARALHSLLAVGLVLLVVGLVVGLHPVTAVNPYGLPASATSCGSVLQPHHFSGRFSFFSYRRALTTFSLPSCSDARHSVKVATVTLLALGVVSLLGAGGLAAQRRAHQSVSGRRGGSEG